MVRITEDLIRKRAEHNNMEISTLEEVSLHQQDVEKIEYLDKWCRDLKILYLQSNLIPKIENVGRLKKLEYLNLALNNIERIENLQGCESLKKLDLTVNFVGELTSIECLKDSIHLRELFLTGNPCTQYEGYRDYVIATLTQLKYLDGKEIEKSERIKARQNLDSITVKINIQQKEYAVNREKEKQEAEEEAKLKEEKKPGFDGRWYTDMDKQNENTSTDDKQETKTKDDDTDFWKEKTAYTPESRVAIHEHAQESKRKEEQNKKPGPDPPKRVVRLMTDDGKYLNVNEAKVDFALTEDEENNQIILDVACYKHLDTSLLDVDVQPTHVKVVLKGKVLQLVLMEEVSPDQSTAQRSQTTGHLVITMPKVKQIVKAIPAKKPTCHSKGDQLQKKETTNNHQNNRTHGGTLEVDPSAAKEVDLMVTKDKTSSIGPYQNRRKEFIERPNSEDFIDDPDVPPLI
ncbi:dynein axonemal assembly factor 11-like [Amphiura filiformis]|uniref:dynein axonemal assembly factor 11-like n=1 Tax=Amphiura filiformis TaxID=82378 RepID=UPI003B21AA0E